MTLEKLKTKEKSSWGGVRPGSGRKPKLQYEARELFYSAIDEEWENIIKVLRYHVRRGNKDVMKWLIEQRIGKAPQSVDISSKNVVIDLTDTEGGREVREIAKRVSAELKVLKT